MGTMSSIADFDSPSGWRDPKNLIARGALKRRYMGDFAGGADARAPVGSLRSVFKGKEDVVLNFLFKTEMEQTRGNIGKALFRRKPPQDIRIVPVEHDVVNVTFDPVDGAKSYLVEIKPSGERDELFQIAWYLKTKKYVSWGMVERGTKKSLLKDPCQKINAIALDVKRPVWQEEQKEVARRKWNELWDAWQEHWEDAREVVCVEPPCVVNGVVGDSTYIARVKVHEWSSFYSDITSDWSEVSPKRLTPKPPPPPKKKDLADEQRHLTAEELAAYGGIENYTKKVKSVRDRLKAQAYKMGGGVDIQRIFERIFSVRDTDGSGSIELDEWTIVCRKDLKMPRFLLKDWEVEMVFKHIDADGSQSIEMDEICAFLDPDHFQLHQDSGRTLRRLAGQLTAVLPHRAFTRRGVGKKTTFVLGMPRIKAVAKKKRHMQLRRVMSDAASYGSRQSLFAAVTEAQSAASALRQGGSQSP